MEEGQAARGFIGVLRRRHQGRGLGGRTDKEEAELKATAAFLQAREYLDSNQVKAIIHHYGANTRRELGLITRAQISEEIPTGEKALKGRKISRLHGSKISSAVLPSGVGCPKLRWSSLTISASGGVQVQCFEETETDT